MTFLNTPEFKVGLMVIVVSSLIGVMSLKVAEGPGVLGRKVEHSFVIDDAGGLVKMGAVKMAGIKVGVVDDIQLENNRAKVILALEPGTKLDSTSKVILKSDGILGDRHVEILPGDGTGQPLSNGQELPIESKGGGGMDSLMSDVSKVAKSLNELMATLNKAVNEGDTSTKIGRIMDNIEGLTEDLSQISSQNKDKLNEIVDRIQSISKNLDENLDAETLAGLGRTVRNMEEITDKVNKGEGTLGRLINDEETVEELNSAISNVNKFLGGANKMETSIDFHTEYLGAVDMSKTFIGVKIQPGLDRFYEVALIDDPRGVKSSKTLDSSSGGNPNPQYEETVTYKNKLKFTALFGKSFYDLSIKGGIIENAGGVGLDYHMINRTLRFSAEFFDFQDLYIRTFVRYDIFKGIYIIGGGDNLARANDDEASVFFGAGLFITNDDLKTLVSRVSF